MGYQNADKAPDGCWYNMIRGALEPQLVAAPSFDEKQTVWRHADEGVRAAVHELEPPEKKSSASVPIPEWLRRSAPAEQDEAPPVRPSNALAAADQSDAPNDEFDRRAGVEAARLGRLMHGLLQHLPSLEPERREDAARRFLAMRAPGLEERQCIALLQQAFAVLSHPELAPLFGPGSQAEVSIAGQVEIAAGKSVDIMGQIDRLTVSATEVLIADFKTGRARPRNETPLAYAVQLAFYRAALAEIYPDRNMRAMLVWVNGPGIIEFTEADMQRALSRVRQGQGDAIGQLGP
jgi:ATP-dependent helicase/nuclease subunit A